MSKELMQEAFPGMQKEIGQALRLAQQNELIKAEEIYLSVLEQKESYPPALYGLAELAGKINDHEVQEDLLRRAITAIGETADRNQKGLIAIWYAELAEILIMQSRNDEAKECIAQSEKIIKENLS